MTTTTPLGRPLSRGDVVLVLFPQAVTMPLASDASSRVRRRQLTPPPRTAPRWMPPAVRRLRRVLPVTGSSAPGAALSLGRSVGRRQGCPDLVAVTFFPYSAGMRFVLGRRAFCGAIHARPRNMPSAG